MSDLPESWIVEVRGLLEQPPPRRLGPREDRQAAVLVPLYVEAGGLWVLLTRRSDALPHHRNQIAFPGGGQELGEDPWAAATREAEEEIGLPAAKALRLGQLDEVATPTGYRILPCVAAIPTGFTPLPDPREVAETFALPLVALANPRLVEEREVVVDGRPRRLVVLHVGNRQVWGVTAEILRNLVARLTGG